MLAYVSSVSRYPWLYGGLAALIALAALFDAGILAMILLLVAAVSLALVAYQRASGAEHVQRDSVRTKSVRYGYIGQKPEVEIVDEEGDVVRAWVLPQEQTDVAYKFVLTSDGYRVVNGEGRVVRMV